jgi:O-antigen ligase
MGLPMRQVDLLFLFFLLLTGSHVTATAVVVVVAIIIISSTDPQIHALVPALKPVALVCDKTKI